MAFDDPPALTTHDIDFIISRSLKHQRLQAGWSQERLAKVMGVTFQQVQKYETGENRVPGARLFLVAQALNVPLTVFFPSTGYG